MCNYASAACRHLPQRGEKDPAKSGSSFPVESLRGSWPHSSHRRSSPNHQSIGSNWISVSDNSWGGFFYSLSFCSTCSKDPPVLNSLLIWKNIPQQFSFLVLPSQAKPLFGDCLFIYYSALAVSWPAPTLSCSSDPRVVAKHSLTFILSPPRNPRVAQIQKIQEAWIQKKRWIFQYCSKRARLIKFLQKFVNLWMKSCV